MDSVYAIEGSTRPTLDREGRCALHLASRGHAGLPAHHRHCAGMALHRCARLHRYWNYLHHHAVRHRAVAAHCANVATRTFAGVEHLGPLRDVSFAPGTERVLRLQRITTDRVLRSSVCVRPACDCYRHCDVSGGGESLSVVRANIRGAAIGPFHPLSDHVQLPCIFGRSRHADRDDRIRTQYESHCDGHRRSESYRDVPRFCWNWRGRAVVGRSALHLLAPSTWSSACPQVGDVSNAGPYAESTPTAAETYGEGNLSVFLAQWKDASPR